VNPMKFITKKDGIEYHTDGQFIYARKDHEVYKLALFDKNFYKLKLFKGVPILEIDGIRMHLVKDFSTPLDYSREVIKKLRIRKTDVVLDTCMGLGYTALEAGKKSKEVITCEISEAVIALAKWNPWSFDVFKVNNITSIHGDIFEEIKQFRGNSFNIIIHDPPRFSKAGDIYSLEFYKELYRISKRNTRLFHYVGSVGKTRKGRKIHEEVRKRLSAAGFKKIKYEKKVQGLFFVK